MLDKDGTDTCEQEQDGSHGELVDGSRTILFNCKRDEKQLKQVEIIHNVNFYFKFCGFYLVVVLWVWLI